MVTKDIDFGDLRQAINNAASTLALAGYREDADALAILTQIIGYRAGDHFSEFDQAADNYLENIKRLECYLKYKRSDTTPPSPTDSAESD